MQKNLFHVAAAVALAAVCVAAHAADGAALAREGNGKGAPPCVACHGADGTGQAAAGFPRLAALDPAYLVRQMEGFADGSRASAVMQPIAAALDDAERHALADYYAALPVRLGGNPDARVSDRGKRLALRGLWSKEVPACVQCHGPGGSGVGAHFPPLAGQPADYIANQLREWQSGKRANDPLGMMKHVADALSGEDIDAVAAWFAAQPMHAAGATP